MYKLFIKRILDILVSFSMLAVLSPLFLIATILLCIANRGKVFFFQKRPGKNEQIFSIIKFKTMTDARDDEGKLLPDKDRLTGIGKFVRKASLDEIPQLINILKGDMSLIGPRPLLLRYLPYYSEEERRRHAVLPGITGLAQVSGRNHLNWDERLAKDLEYIDKMSFWLDARIFFQTIKNVLSSKDVAIDPQSLMLSLDEYRKKT
jgi:lipopolysaccharide/colanic/teichoic acid biosynthesis glycosyltransferase